jgi:hypothetical protein
MLETITQYINMMIKSINNMITNNGEGKGGKGGKGNKLMEGLQTIIILIALAYIFAKFISVFNVHFNYTF